MPSVSVAYPKDVLPFIVFAKKFVQQSGYKEAGFFIDDTETYLIWYKNTLEPEGTPAKVNRRTFLMKVSRAKFIGYTIPMRFFIILHEFFHWYYQTTNEIKADTAALSIYLSLKFPMSEANYAMTKIFSDTPEARQRAEVMSKMIKHMDSQNKKTNKEQNYSYRR